MPASFSIFEKAPCKVSSPTWSYFSHLLLPESKKKIEDLVICNVCKNNNGVIKLYVSQTVSVQRHLEKIHGITFPVKRNNATATKKEANDALIKWIIKKQVPLNLLFDSDFEFFLSGINSTYQVIF